MKEITNKIDIEKAVNGFMVRLNEYGNIGTVKNLPYVFESIESLLMFIEKEFTDEK